MSRLVPSVSASTHEARLKALQEYPVLLKYALEGNTYYASRIAQTHYAFGLLALTPWAWAD